MPEGRIVLNTRIDGLIPEYELNFQEEFTVTLDAGDDTRHVVVFDTETLRVTTGARAEIIVPDDSFKVGTDETIIVASSDSTDLSDDAVSFFLALLDESVVTEDLSLLVPLPDTHTIDDGPLEASLRLPREVVGVGSSLTPFISVPDIVNLSNTVDSIRATLPQDQTQIRDSNTVSFLIEDALDGSNMVDISSVKLLTPIETSSAIPNINTNGFPVTASNLLDTATAAIQGTKVWVFDVDEEEWTLQTTITAGAGLVSGDESSGTTQFDGTEGNPVGSLLQQAEANAGTSTQGEVSSFHTMVAPLISEFGLQEGDLIEDVKLSLDRLIQHTGTGTMEVRAYRAWLRAANEWFPLIERTSTVSNEVEWHTMESRAENLTIEATVSDGTELDDPSAVHTVNGLTYVAVRDSDSFTIVDVSDPSNPTIRGTVSDSSDLNDPEGVYVVGEYAYVAASASNALTIVNVSDPDNPVIEGVVSDSDLGGAQDVHVVNDFAYVAVDGVASDGLTVVNVSNPVSPTVEAIASGSDTNGIHLVGNFAYLAADVANELMIVDVSDPSNPTVSGDVNSSSDLNGPSNVYVVGDFAYVACRQGDSLTVVDISDPTNPTIVGVVSSSTELEGARDVHVVGDFAYVAAGNDDAITTVDVSDPTNPIIVESLTDVTLNLPQSIFIVDDFAYVAAGLGDAITIVGLSPTPIDRTVQNLSVLEDVTGNGRDFVVQSGSPTTIDVGPLVKYRRGVDFAAGEWALISESTLGSDFFLIDGYVTVCVFTMGGPQTGENGTIWDISDESGNRAVFGELRVISGSEELIVSHGGVGPGDLEPGENVLLTADDYDVGDTIITYVDMRDNGDGTWDTDATAWDDEGTQIGSATFTADEPTPTGTLSRMTVNASVIGDFNDRDHDHHYLALWDDQNKPTQAQIDALTDPLALGPDNHEVTLQNLPSALGAWFFPKSEELVVRADLYAQQSSILTGQPNSTDVWMDNVDTTIRYERALSS